MDGELVSIFFISETGRDKEIGHEEPHCGTNISIFSLTWAGLAVFFKAEFI